MGFLKRTNYLGKFTSLFILTGLSFAFIILTVLFFEFRNHQSIINEREAKHEFILKEKIVNNFYSHFSQFLFTIQDNRFFTTYLKNSNEITKVDAITLFETLAKHEKYLTQLRYIDINGNEKIRIDRKKLNDHIFLVPENNLQNKKHRDSEFKKANFSH